MEDMLADGSLRYVDPAESATLDIFNLSAVDGLCLVPRGITHGQHDGSAARAILRHGRDPSHPHAGQHGRLHPLAAVQPVPPICGNLLPPCLRIPGTPIRPPWGERVLGRRFHPVPSTSPRRFVTPRPRCAQPLLPDPRFPPWRMVIPWDRTWCLLCVPTQPQGVGPNPRSVPANNQNDSIVLNAQSLQRGIGANLSFHTTRFDIHAPYRLFPHPNIPGDMGVVLPGAVIQPGALMIAARVDENAAANNPSCTSPGGSEGGVAAATTSRNTTTTGNQNATDPVSREE